MILLLSLASLLFASVIAVLVRLLMAAQAEMAIMCEARDALAAENIQLRHERRARRQERNSGAGVAAITEG